MFALHLRFEEIKKGLVAVNYKPFIIYGAEEETRTLTA
jgi:hypothetical protein